MQPEISPYLMITNIRHYLLLFTIALSLILFSRYMVLGAEQPGMFRSPTKYDLPAQPKNTHLVGSNNAPSFAIPIECTLGENCYIMHYVDRDPGPGAVDFGGGRQTYDTHKGTDFGISDTDVMAQGVAVKAAAAGRVLRVRDGVSDRLVQTAADQAAVENIECGNGIVIDHGHNWETQYCHLRNGSIVVQPGTEVEKGTVLGMVGSSGLASFPHVHLSIRYQGEIVDPFVGSNPDPGCNVARNSLWDQPLEYVPTGAIRAGFATEPPNMNQLWQGKFSDRQLAQEMPMIIFWVHAYGTLKGDQIHFKLTAPNGQTIAESEQMLDDSNRIFVGFVGKRNTSDRPITPGVWRGEYQLTRGDRTLINISRDINVV
jgi:murein DD-endopeptidase